MTKPTIRELEEIMHGPGGAVALNPDGSLAVIPFDIVETVLKIGRAERGATAPHDADGHAAHVRNSVIETAKHFDQTEPQPMNGLYVEGTETVICHTGTSPNSPTTARALTGAWNALHDQCAEIAKRTASAPSDIGKQGS